jgi:hypothetical protein
VPLITAPAAIATAQVGLWSSSLTRKMIGCRLSLAAILFDLRPVHIG